MYLLLSAAYTITYHVKLSTQNTAAMTGLGTQTFHRRLLQPNDMYCFYDKIQTCMYTGEVDNISWMLC